MTDWEIGTKHGNDNGNCVSIFNSLQWNSTITVFEVGKGGGLTQAYQITHTEHKTCSISFSSHSQQNVTCLFPRYKMVLHLVS